MKFQVVPKNINNLDKIIENIPGDKSISHRAIMIGSLAKQEIVFRNFLFADDCINTIKIFQSLGIKINYDITKKIVKLQGNGLYGLKAPSEILNVGNSGTLIRIITGILAAQNFSCLLDGDDSIRTRPMKRVIEPLSLRGAKIKGQKLPGKTDIYPPLTITGQKLKSISYQLPIPSAQIKS
ncbi:MAG: 3-phosphoshikimate 1-carboxyvinyltransferase, partial [Candidatus Margulisiibacteriota bacterium]